MPHVPSAYTVRVPLPTGRAAPVLPPQKPPLPNDRPPPKQFPPADESRPPEGADVVINASTISEAKRKWLAFVAYMESLGYRNIHARRHFPPGLFVN